MDLKKKILAFAFLFGIISCSLNLGKDGVKGKDGISGTSSKEQKSASKEKDSTLVND